MPEITAYQSEILLYLKNKKGFTSPTEIASKVGHYHSSSWASPKCLNLVKQGLLIRNNKGHYAIKKCLKQKNQRPDKQSPGPKSTE